MSEIIEILNERLFAVDHETLFDAFANPEKLVHWWGPNGFTNRIDAFDLRPGGDWRITMTASNGTDFENHSTFEVVEPPHRITFLHHGPIHVFRLDMTFTAEEAGARLRWCMTSEATEQFVELQKFIAAANEQNFERLEQFLGLS